MPHSSLQTLSFLFALRQSRVRMIELSWGAVFHMSMLLRAVQNLTHFNLYSEAATNEMIPPPHAAVLGAVTLPVPALYIVRAWDEILPICECSKGLRIAFSRNRLKVQRFRL